MRSISGGCMPTALRNERRQRRTSAGVTLRRSLSGSEVCGTRSVSPSSEMVLQGEQQGTA